MDLRFALLLICFFLSGFAALLYQTAWTRELSFVFGTSDLAVAVVLAVYMGGLALGAAIAARLAPRVRRPVWVYGVLELAIALCALAVPWGIRGLNWMYVAWLGGAETLYEGTSTAATLFQLAASALVLLPPTALMGATLPLLARHAIHRVEQIGARVGTLYSINTAGAIAGTLVAAFLLMPELGLRRTVYVGALLNAVVFALAALLARQAPLEPAHGEPADAAPQTARFQDAPLWILPAIALSGAVSFAYEVAWTRLLGQVLGASTQAFAAMLASFLIGIALGSALAARLASTRTRSSLGFALAQLGIAVTSYAAFVLSDRLPELARFLGAGPGAHLPGIGVAVATLLPVTLCVGATFPFAVRMLAESPDQAAAATARVYAWNTVGAIAGSLGAGFWLLPGLGFEGMFSLAIGANLALALAAAALGPPRRILVAVPAILAALALFLVPLQPPWHLLKSSPLDPAQAADSRVEHHAVGRTSTVMLLERGQRYQLTTGGLPESWIDPKGMLPHVAVAQWLAALPAMLRPETRSLLVIGLGGGAMLELAPTTYESIDVVELEPEVLAANQRMSARRARDPLADPRTRVVIGDARGALQLLGGRYDAIVSQPSHPWTAGASHLYTKEFFELVGSGLSFAYGRPVLAGFDLELAAGQVVLLAGRNGSGKSTALRLMAGVQRPEQGSVRLGDRSVDAIDARERARHISLVPQDLDCPFEFSVWDYAAMGRYPHLRRFGPPTDGDREAVRRALAQVDALAFADRSVTTLSGGELRRVGIARALATEAPFVLLDEPTANLDLEHALALLDLVRGFAAEGRGVLIASHDLNLLGPRVDRAVLLHDGRAVAAGAPEDALRAELVARVFGVRAEDPERYFPRDFRGVSDGPVSG